MSLTKLTQNLKQDKNNFMDNKTIKIHGIILLNLFFGELLLLLLF